MPIIAFETSVWGNECFSVICSQTPSRLNRNNTKQLIQVGVNSTNKKCEFVSVKLSLSWEWLTRSLRMTAWWPNSALASGQSRQLKCLDQWSLRTDIGVNFLMSIASSADSNWIPPVFVKGIRTDNHECRDRISLASIAKIGLLVDPICPCHSLLEWSFLILMLDLSTGMGA